MARTAVVSGVRTSSGGRSPGIESDPRSQPRFKYEYQSHPDFPALILTLAERIVHWTPNGSRDERPRTEGKSYLDMVRFKDGYLGTDDPELAKLLEACPLFGMPAEGGRFWRKSDVEKAQLVARAAELRRELAANPELAKAALQQSEAQDFELPPAV
jgi:hypothetical protein